MWTYSSTLPVSNNCLLWDWSGKILKANMKHFFLSLLIATLAIVGAKAQQIAVVSENGTTKLYRTLQAAIEGAEGGSVIYLPGGGFPIADAVKITKKLTIIGIGHKIKTENPDGYTTVSGNLFFDKGSDGSALMGCYVTGVVHIGNDGNKVDDVLIKCNNMYRVIVHNNTCMGTNINQNYIREDAHFAGASVRFSNNIADSVYDLDDGYISNNIIIGIANIGLSTGYDTDNKAIRACDRTSITNNIIIADSNHLFSGNDCLVSGNMCRYAWGDEYINLGSSSDWGLVFVKYKGNSVTSDFHFKDNYAKYEGQVGIYHGTFNDDQLAPVPYIVAKSIPEQTDAAGKLKIKIRVKAGDAGGNE